MSSEAQDQEALRQAGWEISSAYPPPVLENLVGLATIRPHKAYACWRLCMNEVAALEEQEGPAFEGAVLILRVHDVTDIEFEGSNAHRCFDIDVEGLEGRRYFDVQESERSLLAEVGFRLRDGRFLVMGSSDAVFFDRSRASSRFSLEGLYVGSKPSRQIPVENLFDARIYQRLHEGLRKDRERRELSVLWARLDWDPAAKLGGRLTPALEKLVPRLERFGAKVRWLPATGPAPETITAEHFEKVLEPACEAWRSGLKQVLETDRPELVHLHDWPAAWAAAPILAEYEIPTLLSLHSTEHSRQRGSSEESLASLIRDIEGKLARAASKVVVPHSSTVQQLTELYGLRDEQVAIVPDVLEEGDASASDPGEIKKRIHLNPTRPMALFAGEIAHATGADLLLEALLQMGWTSELQLVFAGDGPLRAELEARANGGGLGEKVRFLGDVAADWFDQLLLTSDFAVVPGRTWQDEGFSQRATAFGRPVLTTHQAHQPSIVHGQNGLVTYDNPGSIIWGLKEMMSNPLQGQMIRLRARREAGASATVDAAAIELYLFYKQVLSAGKETA